MQGAALTLAEQVHDLFETWGRPDVFLTSDMVHLPALLGFARESLTGVPVVLYLHENQLTYPLPDGATPDHTYAMTNWLSLAVADQVVFNSEYHRRELLDQLPELLCRFPDHQHSHRLREVEAVATTLPVGIDPDRFRRSRHRNEVPVVLWNHRWEYDKDPATFFQALGTVADRGVDFDVIVAGEAFGTVPEAFEQGRGLLGDRIVHFGTADDEVYPELLARADVVVSTARHDFFGVAVAEAVAAGCLPLLPDRLAYPELVPASRPYLYGDDAALVDDLCWALTHGDERRAAAEAARRHVARFAWPEVAAAYDRMLADAAASAS
jgi:glycosyltransferase involved in cell wall biosynthesis